MTGESHHLAVRELSVRFGGLTALQGVTLDLRDGEIAGLIGPNGSGKTTLVNVISGFIRPDAGSVTLDRASVSRLAPHRLARQGLSRTFQGGRLFPRLTVAENIEVAAAAARVARRTSRRRATELMSRFGLTRHSDTPAGALPYGLERLVVVARALASRPHFVLLDEPAAGLDELEGERLAESLRSVRRDLGCGMLVIEHDMHFVAGLCDRLHVLVEGRTLAAGVSSAVLGNQAVIDAYLGAHAGAIRHNS